jgi:membrane-associated phospholipid phosphatase
MRSHRPAPLVASGLLVFAVLTVLVWTGTMDSLDTAVAHFAARHQTSAGTTAARVLTDVFSPGVDAAVLLIGAALLARLQRSRTPIVVALCVLVGVSAAVLAVKHAMNRPLPHSHGHGDVGYPSGHTAATLCFLGVLALLASSGSSRLRRRLLILVGIVSALVVLALVSAGFHWLTDTVASVCLGVAVLALVDRRTELSRRTE